MSETDPILSIAHDIGDIKERCARTEEGIKRVEFSLQDVKNSQQNLIDWNNKQDDNLKELNEIKNEIKAGWKIADWIKHSGVVTFLIAIYHYIFKVHTP